MSRFQRFGTDLDLVEGVSKVAQLVWDADTLSWVRWDGTGGGGTLTLTTERNTKRFDIASDTITYIGEAAPGTPTGTALWRIQRITFDVSGNPTAIQWADSGAATQVWDNRASLSYA